MTPTEKRILRAQLRKAVLASGAQPEMFNAFVFGSIEFYGAARSCESKPMCPRHQRMKDHAAVFSGMLKAMIGEDLLMELLSKSSAIGIEEIYL